MCIFVSKECCRTEIAGNLRQQRSRYIARENGAPSTKLVKFLKIMQLSFFASAAIILSGDVCPQPGPFNQVVYDVPSLSIEANGLSIRFFHQSHNTVHFGGLFTLKQWIFSSLKHDPVPRENKLYCFYVKNPPKRIALWDRENSQ